jgi:Zn-dependent protease with chaperone function
VNAALALLLAGAPALYAWWGGRRLVRMAADPALPERYLGHRLRVAQTAAVAVALLLVLLRPHWVWAIPLMFLATQAAGFPSRRAILGETWGLGAYLGHVVRVTVAAFGFWLLLAFTPALIPDLGPMRWPMALVVGVVLLAWQSRYTEAFLSLTGATPLQRPDLAPRLGEVAGRSRAEPPRLRRVGAPGGRWANAFALPSLRGSSVIFTDTLLDQFTPEETAAVFAHELAHLEHHDRRRLWAGRVALWVAIAVATVAIPLGRSALGVEGSRLDWVWALIVMLALALYGTSHRAHEAESDSRAVALSGDPEALVRALIKLHALARLPRRWDPDMERRSTHPSLAHRLQAIRAAGGVVASGLEQPVVARSSEEGRRVVLDPARIHWLEGVPAATGSDAAAVREAATSVLSVPYSQLTELRLRAALGGPPRLLASDLAGRTWSLPLEAADVAPTQAALDIVEGRLAVPPSGAMHHPALGGVLSTLAVLAAVVAGQFSPVLIPGVAGMFRPTQATLAALGTTAVATGLLALRQDEAAIQSASGLKAVAVAALIVFGLVAIAVAALRARTVRERRTRAGLVTAWLLAVTAAVSWAGLAIAAAGTPRALRLHQAALTRPGAAIALLGMAAALALARRPAARWAALVAAVLAALPLVTASRWFLDRFARDPFLAHPPTLPLRRVVARPLRETRIASGAVQLRLSPSAARFAVRPMEPGAPDEDARPLRRISVRSFSGPEREVEAEDLHFLNDLRVLALLRAGTGLELRAVSLDDAQDVSWTQPLPDLRGARLELDASLGVWRVTGAEPGTRATVVVAGRLNESGFEGHRWPALPAVPAAAVDLPAVASTQGALAVRLQAETAALPSLLLAGLPPAVPLQTELWTLAEEGPRRLATSGLDLRCTPPPLPHADARFTCLAFDGRRTLLWSVDARSGALEPLASMPGRIFSLQPAAPERLLGWAEDGLVGIDTARQDAARIELPADAERPVELAPVGDSLGALATGADSAVVTVYHVGH